MENNLTTSVNNSQAIRDIGEKISALEIITSKGERLMKAATKGNSNIKMHTEDVDNSLNSGPQVTIPAPLINFQRFDLLNWDHRKKKEMEE